MINQLYFSIQTLSQPQKVYKGINRGKLLASVKLHVWYHENGRKCLVDIKELPINHKFAANVQHMLDIGYIQSVPFDLA